MALARWELEQRQKGNIEAAEEGRRLREKYGDVPLRKSRGEEFEEQLK